MKREQLTTALDELVAEGALGAEQRGAVEKKLAERLFQKTDVAGRFVSAIAILGGVLFALGILSLIAINWEGLGKNAKLGGIFATLVGIHALGFYLSSRTPRTAVAITAAGVLSFGGALGLVSQIYHVHENLADGLLVWWLLSAPFVYVTRSPRILEIVLCLFGAWVYVYAHGLLDRHDLDSERPWIAGMSLLTTALGALLAAFASLLRVSAWRHLAPACRRLAIPCVLAGPFALSFAFWSSGNSSPWVLAPSVEIGGAALALSAYLAWRTKSLDDVVVPLAVLAGWAVLAATVVFLREATFLLANVVLLATIVGLIRLGIRRGTSLEINLAILAFLVTVLTRYFEFLHSRIDATVGFLGAGLILLVLGFFLEQRRRAWVREAEARAS